MSVTTSEYLEALFIVAVLLLFSLRASIYCRRPIFVTASEYFEALFIVTALFIFSLRASIFVTVLFIVTT